MKLKGLKKEQLESLFILCDYILEELHKEKLQPLDQQQMMESAARVELIDVLHDHLNKKLRHDQQTYTIDLYKAQAILLITYFSLVEDHLDVFVRNEIQRLIMSVHPKMLQ